MAAFEKELNKLVTRICREWGLPNSAAERAMMFTDGEDDD